MPMAGRASHHRSPVSTTALCSFPPTRLSGKDPNRMAVPLGRKSCSSQRQIRRENPVRLAPAWQGAPQFSEHSYRSFAADGPNGEFILFQNIGYTHAEWTFRDRDGKCGAPRANSNGRGAPNTTSRSPSASAIPNVALKNRAVHFFGVSDIRRTLPGVARLQKTDHGQGMGLRLPAPLLHLDYRHHEGAVSRMGRDRESRQNVRRRLAV